MAEAACGTVDELYELLISIRSMRGVARTETFMYLRLLRQNFEWNRAPQGERQLAGVGAPPELDELDTALVKAVQRNGRAPFREIARSLGVSERVISARYNRLVTEHAVHVTAVVNPRNLGFNAMAWLGIRVADGADVEQVASALSELPAVSYLVMPSGRFDLMAEIFARTTDDLIQTLATSVGAIEGVGTVEVVHYFRLLYPTTAGAWSAARSLVATRPTRG